MTSYWVVEELRSRDDIRIEQTPSLDMIPRCPKKMTTVSKKKEKGINLGFVNFGLGNGRKLGINKLIVVQAYSHTTTSLHPRFQWTMIYDR